VGGGRSPARGLSRRPTAGGAKSPTAAAGPPHERPIRDFRGQARRRIHGPPRRARAANPCESLRRPAALSSARLSSVGWRAVLCQRRFRLKSPPDLCGHFTVHGNARAGFGLQTAPVALLRGAFARWPPWSSPPKRSALRSAMALGFGRPAALACPRSPACFRAGERPPAHCAMAAIARDYGDRIAGAAPEVGALLAD
jgi:hypothetical protein